MSLPDGVRDLPPAATFIAFVLNRDGPLAWGEIQDRTHLPESTLADGLHTLEDHDVIEHDREFDTLQNRRYDIRETNSDIRSRGNC